MLAKIVQRERERARETNKTNTSNSTHIIIFTVRWLHFPYFHTNAYFMWANHQFLFLFLRLYCYQKTGREKNQANKILRTFDFGVSFFSVLHWWKNRFEHTCAICGLRLKSFMSRALGSIVFNRLHNITPSRRVKARTRISASGQFALWSTGIALHVVNHATHSRHKSSDTLVAMFANYCSLSSD